MFGDEPNFSRGDRIGCSCTDCGENYTHIERVDQDPPRSTSLCPDCYPDFEEVRGSLVCGTWRIRDEEFRETMVDLIESETPYSVRVKERVGDLYIYDPDEV